ncbi:MAG: DinB family protein [Bacteroidota bacterium]
MQETAQQYTRRLLGNIQGKDVIAILTLTPKQLAGLLKGKSLARLSKRPARGKWSAAEIVAHFAEVEMVVGYRIRLVLSQNRVPIQAYDQNLWQLHSGYLHENPGRALEMLRVLREANLALLKSLPKKKWKHYGIHQERGKETVTRIVDLLAGHDINHLMQLRKLLIDKEKK